MKTRHLFLLASAVALFTNCMQDEIEVPLTSGTVVATMEDDATKTNVDENFAFTWTTGDKIAIHTTDSNLEGTLKGEGGSTNGTFNYSYCGNAPELSGYATYPYHDGHKVANNELTFVLPATYTLTSLSNTNAPMIAVPTQRATSEAEADFDFKHLAGVFRFVFNNPPAKADKFTLTLGGKKINGTFTATIGNETTLFTGEAADGESTTTLEFAVPEGAKSITLYVPVPTGDYEGITATMYAGKEVLGTWGKATATNTVVRRSVILMAPITFATADGDIENNVNVATEKQLVEAVAKGGTITLTEDITITTKLTIAHNTTIIGGGHTLTYTGTDRAIDVPSSSQVDFTVKNLAVYCSASYCERGLNYNASENFVLDNVTVAGQNLNYAVNLPGSSDNANVAISNSSLTSNLALNVWGENVTVIVNDSHLTSLDRSEAENYAAIVFNNDGATCAQGSILTVNGGSIVAKDQNNEPSTAISNSALADLNISETTEVTGHIRTPVAVVLYEGFDQFYSCYSIEDAISQASADESGKASVKLLADVNAAGLITIPADKALVLDLNGHTFAYTSDVAGDAMITNRGTLTVKDSGVSGKVTYLYTGAPDTAHSKGNYTISNVGTLTLEGGLIENTTAKMSHASYAIDNNSINCPASLTITGGKVLNETNYAVRQFTGHDNVVTITGGEIKGTRAIWTQLPGSDETKAPKAVVEMRGGALTSLGESGYKLAIYSYSYGNDMSNVEYNISGGVIDGDIALTGGKNKTKIEKVSISGGQVTNVYSYGENDLAAKAITITGGTFASLDPLAYMTSGEAADFKLQADTEYGFTVNAGVEARVDLNGHNIIQKYECTESYNLITNKGNLTITGEGKISFEDLSKGGGYAWGSYTIGNTNGTLVVESGTIEHLGTADGDFDTCIPIQNYQGKVTINGGVLSSPEFRSLRDFTAGGEIVINGGTFNGQVWMQGLGNGSSTLVINGGEFGPTANDGSSVYITNGTNDVVVTVNRGKFNTKIGCADPSKDGVKGKVKGGIFTESAKTNTNKALIAEGYEFEQNADGTYTLTQKN